MNALILLACLSSDAPATWCNGIAEIIQAQCVTCHHQGGESPFGLQTHTAVQQRSRFIGEVLRQGVMPPVPVHGGLVLHDMGLTSEHRAMLVTWIAAGSPKGECDLAIPAPKASPVGETHSVKVSSSWTVPAEGGPNWGRRLRDKRTFVLPLGNSEPLRVIGVAHHTSAPNLVHAVTYASDNEGRARWLDEQEEGEGYRMLGDVGWTPSGALGATGVGARTVRLPAGFHWEVPARADLVAETHFRPDGRTHELQERVDLLLGATAGSRPVLALVSMVRKLDIAVDATETVKDVLVLEQAIDLVALLPRASGVCTAMSLDAVLPDGTKVVLARIDDWDPHWRQLMVLPEARRLPAGTQLQAKWTLANTSANGRNPFLPLKPYILAQRTGAVAWVLHAAAVDPGQDAQLQAWGLQELRARQR